MKSYKDYKTSRAIVMERPREVAVREIELTEPLEDAYICQTYYNSISSGTDMKTYFGMQHPEQCYYPLVFGYETMGKIVAVGPKADPKLKVGDRVMINECRKFGNVCSAWGGSSEFTVKDSQTATSCFDYMVKVPDNVSDTDAVLAYLACVALKGVRRLNDLSVKQTIVVVGAGMVGISAMQLLKIKNPEITVIAIDRNAFRRSIAANYVDYVFSPEEAVEGIKKVTNGKMADQLIEASGNPEVVGTLHKYIKEGGWDYKEPRAHIHLQGDYYEKIIFDHYHRWFVKNPDISITCALEPYCKEEILQYMSEGKFDTSKLPVEIWPVSKAPEAFKYKAEKGDDVFKIIFDWSK